MAAYKMSALIQPNQIFCNQFYLSWTRILHIFTGRSGPKKCLMDNLGPTFLTDSQLLGKVSHTPNVRPWWYPQVHETVLPKTSILAFPKGHFRILLLFFAQTEPERRACPLPNSNLPSAKSQSLLSHSLASKPAFGILKKEKNSGNLKSILAIQKVFSCCAKAVVICLFVYTRRSTHIPAQGQVFV